MVKGFSKMYNSSFFGHIFFANIFYYITGFCDKKFNFCKANVFADSKSRAQDLSNDVSFVKFGHQTWDLKGGGKLTLPPQHILVSSTPAEIGLSTNLSLKVVFLFQSFLFIFTLSPLSPFIRLPPNCTSSLFFSPYSLIPKAYLLLPTSCKALPLSLLSALYPPFQRYSLFPSKCPILPSLPILTKSFPTSFSS